MLHFSYELNVKYISLFLNVLVDQNSLHSIYKNLQGLTFSSLTIIVNGYFDRNLKRNTQLINPNRFLFIYIIL